jgi:hypothetical protein
MHVFKNFVEIENCTCLYHRFGWVINVPSFYPLATTYICSSPEEASMLANI